MDDKLVPADGADMGEYGTQPAYVANIYPNGVRDLAFEVWCMVAGRNAKRTAQLLPRYLSQVDEGDKAKDRVPGVSAPDERTIRRWARDENWARRAQQKAIDAAPHLAARWAEEIHGLVPMAIQTLGRIMSGDPEIVLQKGPTVMSQQATALEILKMAGVDQAAFVGKGKPFYVEAAAKDIADMSDDEMLRAHRAAVAGHDRDDE